jgi:8-oxo-dGTP diphosphatase
VTDAGHRVWSGTEWLSLPIPAMGGEGIVVPNVNALVYRDVGRREILLQRRDKPGEVVRGLWELPGGRWRAGENATQALVREVAEETGIVLTAVEAAEHLEAYEEHGAFEITRPLAVVAGVAGSYPSVHVLFSCVGDGDPRPQVGETRDPKWWAVEDVKQALREEPAAFVWHTRAMLAAAFGSS